MIDCIFTVTRIKCVTVRQKRFSALLLDNIGYRFGIVGAEIGNISIFTEVHFDRHQLAVHIDILNACPANQLLKFCGKRNIQPCSEICKINFCFFHSFSILTFPAPGAEDRINSSRISVTYLPQGRTENFRFEEYENSAGADVFSREQPGK